MPQASFFPRFLQFDFLLGEKSKSIGKIKRYREKSKSVQKIKRYRGKIKKCKEKSNCIKDSVYIDDGFSGANFQRPGFQSMLADIEAGLVGTVIVKDMSRLGRNYLQVGMYTELHWTRA